LHDAVGNADTHADADTDAITDTTANFDLPV
jgi:hypothetical protein